MVTHNYIDKLKTLFIVLCIGWGGGHQFGSGTSQVADPIEVGVMKIAHAELIYMRIFVPTLFPWLL